MAFNCIPCSLAESKAMSENDREDQINFIHNRRLPCMYISLQPGEFIVFRQDLPIKVSVGMEC